MVGVLRLPVSFELGCPPSPTTNMQSLQLTELLELHPEGLGARLHCHYWCSELSQNVALFIKEETWASAEGCVMVWGPQITTQFYLRVREGLLDEWLGM